MKPKEFIKKHSLIKKSLITDRFWDDFTSEFKTVVKAQNGEKNPDGFFSAVRIMKSKWDSIRIHSGNTYFTEKAWGWFYANKVIPYKEEIFKPVEEK